ncbi:NADH:ubiquinone oxidoreductase subunit 3 (subunit A) [Paenibacillus sp. DS2015]|uniref:hypothetical protein n=1 Tax=Paenibacillus sp. DS2015 TaxID=3373917 RepID=UPI003D24EBB2
MFIYILVIVVAIIGGVATFLVGISKENKTSNTNYQKKTKANISKLSIAYLVAILLFVLIWLAVSNS